MPNRAKTERNEKIIELANKGWRYVAIANMFKMKVSAVSMVIHRARHFTHYKKDNEGVTPSEIPSDNPERPEKQ